MHHQWSINQRGCNLANGLCITRENFATVLTVRDILSRSLHSQANIKKSLAASLSYGSDKDLYGFLFLSLTALQQQQQQQFLTVSGKVMLMLHCATLINTHAACLLNLPKRLESVTVSECVCVLLSTSLALSEPLETICCENNDTISEGEVTVPIGIESGVEQKITWQV